MIPWVMLITRTQKMNSNYNEYFLNMIIGKKSDVAWNLICIVHKAI